MKRREVLAMAAVSTIAGCGTEGPKAAAEPRRIAVAATSDNPDLPVEPAVTVIEPKATDTHPPQIRVSWTNTGSERVRVGEARHMVFAYVPSADDGVRLLPVEPGSGNTFPTAEPGCWKQPVGKTITVTGDYRTVELSPDESYARTLGVWGYEMSNAEICIPTGTFDFETTVRVEGKTDAGDVEGEWGFTLEVR